jgi:hypothetical protein
MKKLNYIYKIIIVLVILVASSCTEGFDDMNKDPNSFNTAEPVNIFAGVVKNTLNLVGGEMNTQMYLNYASFIGSKGGQIPRFSYTDRNDRYWRTCYVDILKNNQYIIDTYGDDPGYANRVHIAKIWKSYVLSVMVSTWGGVPVTDAWGDNLAVSYESEEDVYRMILTMLKEAGEGIDPAGDKLRLDPVFDRDNSMWIKFANTLRLKIALRISYGFPNLAAEHGPDVMANESGLVSSNGENVLLKWGVDQENWSWYYTEFVVGDASVSNIPYVNFHFLNNLKTYEDPRMYAMVDPSPTPLSIEDTVFASGSTTEKIAVRYEIPYYGTPLWRSPLDAWDLDGDENPFEGVAVEDYSKPSFERFFTEDMTFSVITFAETNFMKAEAALKGWGGSETAEAYHYAGIDASFDQYGVSGADMYKEQDGIKWGTESVGRKDLWSVVTSGISADPMDKIVRQRWIAMFYQGHDSWCLQKRTRLLPLVAHHGPEDPPTVQQYQEIPEKMIYPLTEESINEVGYQDAVAALGGSDEMMTPLKMNKPGPDIPWETLPAAYSSEFASHWYGDSEDDLIANGVDYEILN